MAAVSVTPHVAQSEVELPWHSAYPAPQNTTPLSISHSEVLQLLKNINGSEKKVVLIDLRRTDHDVEFHVAS